MLRVATLAILGLATCASGVTYQNLQPGAQIKLSTSSLQYSGQQVQVRFDRTALLLLLIPSLLSFTLRRKGSADRAE